MSAVRILVLVVLMLSVSGEVAAAPPNIVFIYSDDHGPWALGLEHPQAHTPHLDRLLSEEGARLPHAFVTTPVCSPSRASLLTGRYASELGIHDWIHPSEDDVGLAPESTTWAQLLSEAGYTTALIGKWHLGGEDRFHPTQFGFDEFVGFRGHGPPNDPTIEKHGESVEVEGLTIDILTDHVLDFIDRHRDDRFMVVLSSRAPHRAWLPVADEDWAPYEGVDPEIPDYPGIDRQDVRRKTREYLASVTSVDRNVGRILGRLDEHELARDTVVIFTANEGNNLGHHGAWGKGNAVSVLKEPPPGTRNIPGNRRPNLMDTVLRVPTGVRWPGVIEGGTVVEQTVSNLDWFPTLLAMAGVGHEHGNPRGRNFLPLLLGDSPEGWDNDLYAEYSPHHGIRAHMRAWRTPRWKLVRDFLNPWRDELYDLHNDPQQRENLINDGRFEIRMAKQALHERIIEKMRELDDPILESIEEPSGGARP